jgi:hypothetical protein
MTTDPGSVPKNAMPLPSDNIEFDLEAAMYKYVIY